MDKYKLQTVLNKWVSPIILENLEPSIQNKIQSFDRYQKNIDFPQVLKLFLHAIQSKKTSLRDIDSSLVSKTLQKVLGTKGVKYSQLSRILRDIDTEILEAIFQDLLGQVHALTTDVKEKFYLIDSSTFSLNRTLYQWADFRKTKAGVKLHLKVCHMGKGQIHPKEFVITTADKHDNHFLNCFVNESLATYVFDRGYLDFKQLDQMHWDGYFFVTRIKKNTVVHQVKRLEVSGRGVINDEIVILGSQTYLTSRFRLVTIETANGKILEFLTNRFDLSAVEIAQMYESRWQIELFFKHIKQHMTIKKYFSTSESGVINQIYLAMIAYLLSFLMKLQTESKKSIFQIIRHLNYLVFEPFERLLAYLRPT